MQRNWIGKSTGAKVWFPIEDEARGKNNAEKIEIFTTRIDTIYGAIYHSLLLRPGSLTQGFGEELVEQVLRGARSGSAHL